MLIVFLFLILFLLAIFTLNTLLQTLSEMGEMRGARLIEKNAGRFFYYPLHKLLFRKKTFRLLLSTLRFGENFYRLLFGVTLFTHFYVLGLDTTLILPYFIIALVALFFFGSFLPHVLALRKREKKLPHTTALSAFFLFFVLPFSYLFLLGESVITKRKRERREALLEEELKETLFLILQDVETKEPLTASDKKLLESVIKFKDRIVREIMIPRVDLFCLPEETPLRDAAYLIAQDGYSRAPLYRETVDNIVGVLHVKDLLEVYMECETGKKEWSALEVPVGTLGKKVYYTPETKKVSYLLQELKSKQTHMAIVVDEYGGTEGVITIEDILEEIVGEIGDEYDVGEEMLYVPHTEGGWVVDARMSINDAEETFAIHIPQEGDYDTIGGYIFHVVKAIPPKGYLLPHEDFDMEILSSTDRSIEKVKILPKKPLPHVE